MTFRSIVFGIMLTVGCESSPIRCMTSSSAEMGDQPQHSPQTTFHLPRHDVRRSAQLRYFIQARHSMKDVNSVSNSAHTMYKLTLAHAAAALAPAPGLQYPLSSGLGGGDLLAERPELPGGTPISLCKESSSTDLFNITSVELVRQPVYMYVPTPTSDISDQPCFR